MIIKLHSLLPKSSAIQYIYCSDLVPCLNLLQQPRSMCCNPMEKFKSCSKGDDPVTWRLVRMLIQAFTNSICYHLQAAEQLKITATELCKLKIADGVIPVMFFMTYNSVSICKFQQ